MSLLGKRQIFAKECPRRRNCQLRSTWRAIFVGGYTLLLGLVMPFICFGAMAEPGHPHRFPHFVFVDPTLAPSFAMQMMPATHAEHTNHGADNATTRHQMPVDHGQQPVGRGVSSLALFSMMVLVSALWRLSTIASCQFLRFFSPPFPESVTLSLLLPPPRTHSLNSFC